MTHRHADPPAPMVPTEFSPIVVAVPGGLVRVHVDCVEVSLDGYPRVLVLTFNAPPEGGPPPANPPTTD